MARSAASGYWSMCDRQGWSVRGRWEQARALAGDMQAARIILDRLVPSLRPVEMPAVLRLPASATLASQAKAVVNAAAAGELDPIQAAQIVTALGGVAKSIEATELLERIEALKRRGVLYADRRP